MRLLRSPDVVSSVKLLHSVMIDSTVDRKATVQGFARRGRHGRCTSFFNRVMSAPFKDLSGSSISKSISIPVVLQRYPIREKVVPFVLFSGFGKPQYS